MKRFICLCLTLLMLVSATACKKLTELGESAQQALQTLDQDQALVSVYDEEEEFEFEQRVEENKELTAKGCPPLPEDLQKLFAGAKEMVDAFDRCQFTTEGVTREINGMPYSVIVDSRFGDYEGLKTYLQQLFTEELIYDQFLNVNSPVQCSDDGLACVLQASGASDITYAGHVFSVDSYTTKKIELTATVYHVDDVYMGEYFYTTPANPDDYTTNELAFTLVRTDDGWRFSQCPCIG